VTTPPSQALYDEDLADGGYVWNASRFGVSFGMRRPAAMQKWSVRMRP
jgi:hypothetical protein